MEQLPKIVGQRLQAVSREEMHPDANLLAAFAEKSLLQREQVQILEHLAGCADCREVVAHAQPEEVLQQVAVAAAAPMAARRSSWFSGAVIRWAGLAACVVVVGAVVISRARFEKSPASVASNNEPVAVAKTGSQSQPAPNAPAEEKENAYIATKKLKAAPVVAGKRDFDQLAELDKQRATNAGASGAIDEERKAESVNGMVALKNAPSSTADTVTASREPATQTVVARQQEDAKSTKKEFSADKAMRAKSTSNEVAQAQAASVAAPPPPPAAAKSTLADSAANRAEESVQSNYNQKDGYIAGAAIGGFAKTRVVIPMWQISEDGRLIKSLDHGQNWQPVRVDEKTVFRALSVTVHEIWVGGAQGNLYYSSDEGQQWEQVKPVAKGQILIADITAIEFKDSKHGKVTTADHQTWITNDGGHDWKVESR